MKGGKLLKFKCHINSSSRHHEGKCYQRSIHELARKYWKFNKVLQVAFVQRTTSPELDHLDGQVQQAQKFTGKVAGGGNFSDPKYE